MLCRVSIREPIKIYFHRCCLRRCCMSFFTGRCVYHLSLGAHLAAARLFFMSLNYDIYEMVRNVASRLLLPPPPPLMVVMRLLQQQQCSASPSAMPRIESIDRCWERSERGDEVHIINHLDRFGHNRVRLVTSVRYRCHQPEAVGEVLCSTLVEITSI